MAEVEIRRLRGAAIGAALDDLARLRIEVFRAWPYLYAGTVDYERRYLARFAASPVALVVGASAAGRLVGAATALPLGDEHEAFRAPLAARGLDPGRIYYLAESVLLPAWRGRGLGHAFFDHREAEARAGGFEVAAFCAVVRPDDDPRKPRGYRPLDTFWRKRGYTPLPGAVAEFAWRDVGEDVETAKPLQFWSRLLVDESAAPRGPTVPPAADPD